MQWKRARHGLARLCLAVSVLVLSGCSARGAGGGTPTGPPPAAASPTPVVSATPTPEPAPDIILFGGSPYLDAESVAAWAGTQGWGFTQLPVEELDAWAGRPGLRAVILADPDVSAEQLDAFSAWAYIILLEASGLEPGDRVSTVGEPGARRDQVGFAAGMMVGMATDTRSVGLLAGGGAEHEAVYRMGFIHGLRFACPRCGLVEDAAAISNPDVLQEARVDALLVLPGPGAAEAAERMMASGIWVVWPDVIPAEMPQDRLAGWAHFDAAPLVIRALEAASAGQPGAAYPYSAETGGIAFQVVHQEAISPGRLGFIQRAWERMKTDDLDTGVDPLSGAER